ncbi:MAG TPA: bifunctional riboflavin kinase/FAD synthetase [Leucothrix mucor]|nr:bifunctional riboflavin kinase/FAD synthetase [Leucothrix mucor]
MKFSRNLHSYKNISACVATIGNFDGLHLGHQQLFSRLKEEAKQRDLPLTVISFEPLPAEFFMPNPPARIYPLRDKVRLLEQLGVDHFLCLKFDSAFASIPADVFVSNILLDKLNARYLAVGDDFRFGHNRLGDFDMLKIMGEEAGMEVTNTATCLLNDERISSSRIRQSLEKGDIASSNQLLGHSYQLSGRVRHGDKRGRTIGFPTLNMKMPEHIAPARGVYAVRVKGLGNGFLNGVANLGSRPTVNGTENRLEIHLFDFDSDVYGKYVCVELVEFLREEQRFDDFEMLKKQILKDAGQARELLA